MNLLLDPGRVRVMMCKCCDGVGRSASASFGKRGPTSSREWTSDALFSDVVAAFLHCSHVVFLVAEPLDVSVLFRSGPVSRRLFLWAALALREEGQISFMRQIESDAEYKNVEWPAICDDGTSGLGRPLIDLVSRQRIPIASRSDTQGIEHPGAWALCMLSEMAMQHSQDHAYRLNLSSDRRFARAIERSRSSRVLQTVVQCRRLVDNQYNCADSIVLPLDHFLAPKDHPCAKLIRVSLDRLDKLINDVSEVDCQKLTQIDQGELKEGAPGNLSARSQDPVVDSDRTWLAERFEVLNGLSSFVGAAVVCLRAYLRYASGSHEVRDLLEQVKQHPSLSDFRDVYASVGEMVLHSSAGYAAFEVLADGVAQRASEAYRGERPANPTDLGVSYMLALKTVFRLHAFLCEVVRGEEGVVVEDVVVAKEKKKPCLRLKRLWRTVEKCVFAPHSAVPGQCSREISASSVLDVARSMVIFTDADAASRQQGHDAFSKMERVLSKIERDGRIRISRVKNRWKVGEQTNHGWRDVLFNLTFTDMEHAGEKIEYHMEVQFCHQKMRLIRGHDFGGHDVYADARSAIEILEVLGPPADTLLTEDL